MVTVNSFQGVSPQIAQDVFVADGAVIIGRVSIMSGSSVWYNSVLRGDVNTISIGRASNIQDSSVIHVDHNESEGVIVGDNVTIGHGAIIHACRIEGVVLIGMGAVILNGAHIKSQSMIAAGAVVTPNTIVESGVLYAGVPAKRIRCLSKEEIVQIAQSAQNYQRYAAQHAGI